MKRIHYRTANSIGVVGLEPKHNAYHYELYRCGCTFRVPGSEWTLCQYHQGYNDASWATN